MIKAAVFDLGGVVVDFSPQEIVDKFTNDKVEAKLYLDTIHSSLWRELDRGTRTKEDIANLLEDFVGQPFHRTMSFFELINDNFSEIQATTSFIEELSEKGYEYISYLT